MRALTEACSSSPRVEVSVVRRCDAEADLTECRVKNTLDRLPALFALTLEYGPDSILFSQEGEDGRGRLPR